MTEDWAVRESGTTEARATTSLLAWLVAHPQRISWFRRLWRKVRGPDERTR